MGLPLPQWCRWTWRPRTPAPATSLPTSVSGAQLADRDLQGWVLQPLSPQGLPDACKVRSPLASLLTT